MDKALNKISGTVRSWMFWPARFLNFISGGRIKPDHVTLVSLLGHLSVVWALMQWRPLLAALLLAFFGIMDTLDGALARLQKTTSLRGMFFDSVSDRIKEVLVYIGVACFISQSVYYNSSRLAGWLATTYASWGNYGGEWLVVAVCGLSLVISYVKAKGEMALSSGGTHDSQLLNRVFSDGFARYEVRMTIIIIGLLSGQLFIIMHILLILLVITVLQRIIKVSKALNNV